MNRFSFLLNKRDFRMGKKDDILYQLDLTGHFEKNKKQNKSI